MADNAILFKYIAKTTGLQYGILPTFMAKPYSDQPGCSGHVHISLRDKEGRNLFAVQEEELREGRKDAKYEDTKRVSKECEWFLAGVLEGLPDIVESFLFFLSINSISQTHDQTLNDSNLDALSRPNYQRVPFSLPLPLSPSPLQTDSPLPSHLE